MSLIADQDTSHDDLPRASFTSFEESTAEDWAKIIP
ncbi:MAG: phosphohydrolase, partial [Acidimicrobiaceae bacterium]|nr:phosphohydrolase [Acidimicrobiaceae bacterium]